MHFLLHLKDIAFGQTVKYSIENFVIDDIPGESSLSALNVPFTGQDRYVCWATYSGQSYVQLSM